MIVTLDKDEFCKKLELVSRISVKHITLPVLQCVLIESGDDVVVLRATNLEIGLEVRIKAKTSEGGVVAVPSSVLLQTINLSTEKEITLRTEEGSLLVEGGGSQTQIKSVPHEEFPTIPKLTGGGQVIDAPLLALGLKAVAFAASQSSIKPELGSVYVFQKKEHSLTLVTTDSFRLMEKTIPQKGVIFEGSILIPHKNAIEIARVCDAVSGEVACRFNDNQFSLEFSEGVYITSRLVSGTFPDYEQIIPKEYATKTTLLKEDLAHVFKKTSIFLNKFFQVGLTFTKDSVTVNAGNNDVGTTTESIRARMEGEELSLNFNQRYVSEALGHFVDDSIVLNLAGIGRPMVIRGVSDVSVRYLVMPMNK